MGKSAGEGAYHHNEGDPIENRDDHKGLSVTGASKQLPPFEHNELGDPNGFAAALPKK